MKIIFGALIVGLFMIIGCQNSKNRNLGYEKINSNSLISRKGDTLLIKDSINQSGLFLFGDRPLKHLLEIGGKPSFLEITEETDSIENDSGKFVTRINGLVYRLKFGEDYFQMYRRADSVEFFIGAEIATNKFQNKWGIKIGIAKDELIKKLGQFRINEIPTTLIIGDLDYSFVQFDFEKNKLYKITYSAYID